MYLFYCDETSLDPAQSEFFVYGGIAVPAKSAYALHKDIEQIRNEAGISDEWVLKFNPCPPNMEYKKFTAVKELIIRSASKHGCVLIVSIILHKIARNIQEARRNEINRVVFHFDCFLNHSESHGLVLIDRFSDRQIDAHLRRKFSVGIEGLPYSPIMKLERIVGYHYSAIGQSHFPSLIDIVLGSLRYAINTYDSQSGARTTTARTLLCLLEPLFYRDLYSGKVHNISLNFSPNTIRVGEYRKKYEDLKTFLEEAGIVAAQQITDIPMY